MTKSYVNWLYYNVLWLTNYCTATPPALGSFSIIARPKGLGGVVGFVPPVRARVGLVNRGVSCRLVLCTSDSADNAKAFPDGPFGHLRK